MNTRNQKQPQQQKQKPAQASSKARGRKRWSKERRTQVQQEALTNATSNQSLANFPAIIEGFMEMGIPEDQILPRVNVFTFNAWLALGRVVRKGEHGVRVVTVIPCSKKDKETGEETPVRKVKPTTVFHITQTRPLDEDAEQDQVQDAPPMAVLASPSPIVSRPVTAEDLKTCSACRMEAFELVPTALFPHGCCPACREEFTAEPELERAKAAGFGCVAAWKEPNWFRSVLEENRAFNAAFEAGALALPDAPSA